MDKVDTQMETLLKRSGLETGYINSQNSEFIFS